MIKSLKNKIIVLLTFIVCLSFGSAFAMNGMKKAKAEETAPVVNFATVGASVRLNDPCGLRFVAAISKAEYEGLADKGITYGLAFVPESYLSTYGDLNYDNLFGENATYSTTPIEGKGLMVNQTATELFLNEIDNRYELRVALTNIKETNVNRTFAAKSYYVYNDGAEDKYVFESGDYTKRSIVSVSTDALNDTEASYTDEQKEILNNYVKTGYLADTSVKTPAHLYTVMQSTTGKTYTLANDIDMTGYKFGSDAETLFSFKGVLDGAGHKITGISFENNIIQGENYSNGSYVWKNFDGQLKNVTLEITAAVKADTDPTNNYGYPDTGIISNVAVNTEIENVYTKVNYDGKNAKYRNATTPINEPWFFVVGYTAGGLKLTNVVHNVKFANCSGMGIAPLVRSLQNSSFAINDSFVITNNKNRGLIGKWYSAQATVSNGNDGVLTYEEGSMYNGKYMYDNISALVVDEGNYKNAFTHEMWNDILVYSDEEFYADYTAVSTPAELYAAMQDSTGNKYYLKNDVDMTGYKFGSDVGFDKTEWFSFKGILEGNGHKVTGISFNSNIITGENGSQGSAIWYKFDGTLKNIVLHVSAALQASEDTTKNYGYPDTGIIFNATAGATFENVYTKVNFDVKSVKWTSSSSGKTMNISEAWFFFIGYSADNISLNNVIHNVTFASSNGSGIAPLVRSLKNNMTVNNSFVISNLTNRGLFGAYVDKSDTTQATVANGADDVLTYNRSSMYAGKYLYSSISALLAAEGSYRQYFTNAMWNDILV